MTSTLFFFFPLLGSLAPTTPLVPVRKRSRAAESRPVAGPSKPASKSVKGRSKNAKKVPEDLEIADVVHIPAEAVDDEIVELLPSTKGMRSHSSVPSESVAGSIRSTAKGKAKADPPQPAQSRSSRRAARPIETTIISDDNELAEDTDLDQLDQHKANGAKATGFGKKPTTSVARSSANADATTRELERLRERLGEVYPFYPSPCVHLVD